MPVAAESSCASSKPLSAFSGRKTVERGSSRVGI